MKMQDFLGPKIAKLQELPLTRADWGPRRPQTPRQISPPLTQKPGSAPEIQKRHFAILILKLHKVTLVSSEEITIQVIVYVQTESETTDTGQKQLFRR